MKSSYNAVVIGGGCLGVAAAISIKRRLKKSSDTARVCLVEKRKVGSGITARQSGIVRSANASPEAAKLAKLASQQWHDLESLWGVAAPIDACGALWIAKNSAAVRQKWDMLERSMATTGVDFKRLSRHEARNALPDCIRLYEDEIYFAEKSAFQFDPCDIRSLLYRALEKNSIEVREDTSAEQFERAEDGSLNALMTGDGDSLEFDYVVNAAGAWSPQLFASIGISVPVGLEAVNVVNWLTSARELTSPLPVIADYVNLAYFRQWRGNELHMHQPRSRDVKKTARAFVDSPQPPTSDQVIRASENQHQKQSTIDAYEQLTLHRFSFDQKPVYGSGFQSYFDITQDLQFILGPDHRVSNLIHCLGAGQSFKFTPVFGEIIADFVTGGTTYADMAKTFSIERFNSAHTKDLLGRASAQTNAEHTVAAL